MTDSPSAPASLPSAKSFLLLALTLIAVKALFFVLLGGPHVIWDSHWYLNLAENIAAGWDYSIGDGQFHAKYPPAFPLLIALLGKPSGSFELAAAALVFLSSLGLCFLTHALGSRTSTGRVTGPLAALLFALHHLSLIHSSLILTEQIFAVTALLSLMLATKPLLGSRDLAAAILLAGLASLIRYEGLLVFPIIFWQFRNARAQRYFRSAPPVAAAAAVAGFWALWIAALLRHGASPFGGEYGQELARFSILNAVDFLVLGGSLGLCFLLLSLTEALRIFRHGGLSARAFTVFAALYFLIHLSWWFSDVRFYLVLLPLLCVCAAQGIVDLSRHLGRSSYPARFCIGGILSALLLVEQWHVAQPQFYEYRQFNSLYLRQYDLMKIVASWANAHLPDATFAVPEVPVYSRYLGKSRVYAYVDLGPRLSSQPGSKYLIIDNMHYREEDIQSALKGVVTVPGPDGITVRYAAKILYKAEAHLTADDDRYAAIAEITGLL